jgi:predicted transcriptional regulator
MYETEQKLVDEITTMIADKSFKIPGSSGTNNQVVLTEVNLGFGVADIVLTECGEHLDSRNTYLSPTDVKVLSIVNDRPGLSIEDIIWKTKNSKVRTFKSLEKLEDLGFVTISKNQVSIGNKYQPTVKRATAIEVKLKNWKRALKQAYRYKWFSDRSFVCLPYQNIQPAVKNLDKFKEIEVGLIGVCPEEGVKIFYCPEFTEPISEDMSILLNENVLNEITALNN